MYTNQEQYEMNRILRVFRNYLNRTPHLEIIPVSPFGYVCISGESDPPILITCPEHLCSVLFTSIAADVLTEYHSRAAVPSHASKAAKSAIRKRLNPYLRQLPQYRPLLTLLLEH